MNREMKFRGKCTFSGAWRHGYYYQSKGNHIIRDRNDNESIVLQKTVEEFIGLLDEKGKEIYTGDILKTSNDSICHVVFQDTGFAVKSPGSEAIDWEFSNFYSECEIIGNIIDNPELLSVGKK